MSQFAYETVSAATLEARSIEELDRPRLLATLKEYHFARIVGLIDPAAIRRSRELMEQQFRPEDDNATTGEHHSAVRDNYTKLSIGRARHGGVDRPRLMRCFYLPMWAEDVFEMQDTFRKVAQVRNLLGNRDIDFAIDRDEDGMWTASRIHHFPAGGGFMVSHRDTVLPRIYEEGGLGDFFQPLLLLSQKGVDFHEGGGFAQVQDERILYEDYADMGDIVIYDTSTEHGVEDVDPTKPFRQASLAGRLSGLVTLFKSLS